MFFVLIFDFLAFFFTIALFVFIFLYFYPANGCYLLGGVKKKKLKKFNSRNKNAYLSFEHIKNWPLVLFTKSLR